MQPDIDSAQARRIYQLQLRDGAYETLIERFYAGELQPCAVTVDGGAHVGLHTAPMARLVGANGRVLAFEPLPELAERLRQQFAGQPQVSVFENALSHGEGHVNFQHIVNEPWLSSLVTRDFGPNHPHLQRVDLQVQAVTLDRFADLPVRFIKLDLEGADYFALQGAQTMLTRHRPIVVFECGGAGAAAQAGYGADAFFGFFAAIGYSLLDLLGRPYGPREFALPWNNFEVPHYIAAVPAARSDAAGRLRDAAWQLLQESSNTAPV
jgi:FkbM family methyltransferase